MNALRISFVLLLCLPFAAMAGRQAPLVDPPPVPVPLKLKKADVEKAVKQALVGRGWSVGNAKGGYLEGTLFVRKHMAKIGVDFSKPEVAIKYLDSTALEYEEEEGNRLIHPNYNKWIDLLVQDVRIFMEREAISK